MSFEIVELPPQAPDRTIVGFSPLQPCELTPELAHLTTISLNLIRRDASEDAHEERVVSLRSFVMM